MKEPHFQQTYLISRMPQKLHIVAPDIHRFDAVGNHCLYLAEDLRNTGLDVQLYAQRFSPPDVPVHALETLFTQDLSDSLLLVSYSIFDPYLERLLALPCRKLCYFHGVTPPELLREHEPVTADLCQRSIEQFPLLAGFDRLVLSSQLNQRFLERYAPGRPSVVIPPVSPNFPQFQPGPVLEHDRNEGLNLLVLGRVVPHKRLEDAIQVLALLRQHGVAATLNIVGSSGNRVYQDHLDQLVLSLRLGTSVHFKGLVDAPALLRAYSESDALLLTSEHEGFGVPVLEAMHRGLPVVMREGTAASEVGADAVQNFVSIEQAADQLQRLAQEPWLRETMVKTGRRRAAELLAQASAGAWQKLLQEVDAKSGFS